MARERLRRTTGGAPRCRCDPAPDSFEGAVDVERPVRLAETDQPALVLSYAPELARDDVPGHWYVDVSMPAVAETSSWPFVSLAVARYQPNSVDGQALSRMVRCEPVQLLPRRTLRVTRSGVQATWALNGLGQDLHEGFGPQGMGGEASRVTAHLERLPAGTGRTDVTAARADLGVGWQRVGKPLGSAFEIPAGDEPLRLVVREVQPYAGSPSAQAPAQELDERLTFLDVVTLR